MTGLDLQDKGWISPPDSIYDDSSDSGATSTVDSVTGSEVTEPLPDANGSKENTDASTSSPCEVESKDKDAGQVYGDSIDDGQVDVDPIDDVASRSSLSETNVGVSNLKLGTQLQEESHKSPTQNTNVADKVSRVKSKFLLN